MNGRRIAGVAAAAAVIVAAWLMTVGMSDRIEATHEYLITKYYRFETLYEEEIVQYFTPEYHYLDAIELFIANIYPETDGHIQISITDEKGKAIFDKRYRASEIPTGEFYTYKIGKKIEAGKSYTLCVSYEGDSEELPQIMVSDKNKNLQETEDMYVHGEEMEYNMAVTWHYKE